MCDRGWIEHRHVPKVLAGSLLDAAAWTNRTSGVACTTRSTPGRPDGPGRAEEAPDDDERSCRCGHDLNTHRVYTQRRKLGCLACECRDFAPVDVPGSGGTPVQDRRAHGVGKVAQQGPLVFGPWSGVAP